MSNVSILKNGSTEYVWVKKVVNKRQLDQYLANPAYKMLNQSEFGAVVAFKRLVETNEPIPNHLEMCNIYETDKLKNATH